MTTASEIGMHPQKVEGKVTTEIEARTARVPSGTYLSLAVGSMIAAAACQLAGKKNAAQFIGQWVPSLLVIGVYNKLVKIEQELLDAYSPRRASFGG